MNGDVWRLCAQCDRHYEVVLLNGREGTPRFCPYCGAEGPQGISDDMPF